ncbi:MAG: carboxypeptidase-like regulatory domain-containing protein [Flavobacteriaceae bacterium]
MKSGLFLGFVLIFFKLQQLTAQKVTLKGVVQDSLQNPLEAANIMAVKTADQTLESFGISNEKGEFKLRLKAQTEYRIKISFLGFEPQEIPLQVGDKDEYLPIRLQPLEEQLSEVEVVHKIPIQVKGDTIVYQTEVFVNGTERKLKDVLKKLPGIQVTDDGQVKVQGKEVKKIMVEGDTFFDGSPSLATNNIPADALEEVEVYRNYAEVEQLAQVTNNQDNIAMNIKLKENKKNFWFGELGGGIDVQEKYRVDPALFYYSPSHSINALANLNDTGQLNLNPRMFGGGGGNGMRRSFTGPNGTLFNDSDDSRLDTGGGGGGGNNARMEYRSGAFNFTLKPDNSWRFNGFVNYNENTASGESQSTRQFIQSDAIEERQTTSYSSRERAVLKLTSRHTPTKRLRWDHQMHGQIADQLGRQNILTQTLDASDEIVQNNAQNPFRFEVSSNLYFNHSPKHIFALESQLIYADIDPFNQTIRSDKPFEGLIEYNDNQEPYNINREQYKQTNRWDIKLDYYWVFRAKQNLNFTMGWTQSNQRFNSDIFQRLRDGSRFDYQNPQLFNDVAHTFQDGYMGFRYRMKTKKLIIYPGVFLHRYTTANRQLGEGRMEEWWFWTPNIFMSYQLTKDERLELSYRVDRGFQEIVSYAEGYTFRGFNELNRGNARLRSSLYRNIGFNFSSMNMFHFQNIHLRLSYAEQIRPVKSRTLIEGVNRVNTLFHAGQPDTVWNGDFQWGRKINVFNINTNARVSYSETFNDINGVLQASSAWNQSYTADVRIVIDKFPELSVGMNYRQQQNDIGTTQATYYTQSPFIRLSHRFLKGFTFNTDFTQNYYRDKAGSVDDAYNDLNAYLAYQKANSPWLFSIAAQNLTANEQVNANEFNDLYTSQSTYNPLEPFIIFGLKYVL